MLFILNFHWQWLCSTGIFFIIMVSSPCARICIINYKVLIVVSPHYNCYTSAMFKNKICIHMYYKIINIVFGQQNFICINKYIFLSELCLFYVSSFSASSVVWSGGTDDRLGNQSKGTLIFLLDVFFSDEFFRDLIFAWQFFPVLFLLNRIFWGLFCFTDFFSFLFPVYG